MINRYILAAMRRAHYELLEDGGGFYGSITGFPGLWAQADTLEACREELQDSLEGWLLVSFSQQMEVPVIDDIDLAVRLVA